MPAAWWESAASATSARPGTVDCGTGRSSIGQTGSPVTRSNTYVNACLLTIATALIGRPSTVMSTRFGDDAKS